MSQLTSVPPAWVSSRYIRRVVHGDPVLISELRGAAEQSCRRRYDPTVARDPVDCFQQWSDTAELAPASNCFHLLGSRTAVPCGLLQEPVHGRRTIRAAST
jgi:hypothetical protein